MTGYHCQVSNSTSSQQDCGRRGATGLFRYKNSAVRGQINKTPLNFSVVDFTCKYNHTASKSGVLSEREVKGVPSLLKNSAISCNYSQAPTSAGGGLPNLSGGMMRGHKITNSAIRPFMMVQSIANKQEPYSFMSNLISINNSHAK